MIVMIRGKYILFTTFCFLLWGCRHEIDQVYPPEVEPYVSAFFLQAHLRGYDLYEEHFNFTIRFGETHDPESNLHHLAHALTNVAFLHYLETTKKGSKVTTSVKSV